MSISGSVSFGSTSSVRSKALFAETANGSAGMGDGEAATDEAATSMAAATTAKRETIRARRNKKFG
jgi:hypothetical protein